MTNSKNYKTDAQGIVAHIEQQIESLVLPNLTVLQALLLEREGNVRHDDKRLEVEQARLVTDAYAAAARLFIPEVAIDAIDIPSVAPYLALPSQTAGGHDEH